MNREFDRRLRKLEHGMHGESDNQHASKVFLAWERVKLHPEQATEEDRYLVSITSHEQWSRAFGIVINSVGGLAAVVRASYETRNKTKDANTAESDPGG